MNGKEFEALIDDVKHRIEKIRTYANDGDNGNAHAYEDDLLYFVLGTIRDKSMTIDQAKLLVMSISEVSDIGFSHWYE